MASVTGKTSIINAILLTIRHKRCILPLTMDVTASKKISPVLFHAILTLCIALIVVFVMSCFIATAVEAGMEMDSVAAHGMLSDHGAQKSHDHHVAIATLWQQEWTSVFAILILAFGVFFGSTSFLLFLKRMDSWIRFRKRWRIGNLDNFLQRFFQQGILHPKTF